MGQYKKIKRHVTLLFFALLSFQCMAQELSPNRLWWFVDTVQAHIAIKEIVTDARATPYFDLQLSGVCYNWLKPHTSEIIKRRDYKTVNWKPASYVYGLLDLPDSVKQYFIADTAHIELAVRARLGDRKAEDSLLLRFKHLVTDRKDSLPYKPEVELKLMYDVLYVGTPRALKAYGKAFRSKAFYPVRVEIWDEPFYFNRTFVTDLIFFYACFYQSKAAHDILTNGQVMIHLKGTKDMEFVKLDTAYRVLRKEFKQSHHFKMAKIRMKFLQSKPFYNARLSDWMLYPKRNPAHYRKPSNQ